MLLSLMRKHAKSYLIKFLIGIIAVVFVFYFGYSFSSKTGVKIADVNGEPISGVEYQKVYRNLLEGLQRDYKNAWSDNLIKVFDLKNRALESLINQKLVGQEARRIGLDVTENEIQNEIMAYPAFQFRGRFDETRYRSLLQQNRMKAEDFEAGIAQELLQKKLEQFLATLLPVTDREVLDHYTFSNQETKISFVRFLPEDFEESLKLDQTEMEEYFNEHKEEYRTPDKIKVAYIIIDPNEFRDKADVTDQQVIDYYEENMGMFKEEKQVRASHILFKLDRDATEEEEEKALEKAMSVLKRARQGEDFSSLAREYSEGPSSEKGGDLGFFSSGQMDKPFEEIAFKMKKGEISDPVKTRFGYHIIKVEEIKEARTKSLEEVREQIVETFIDMTSMDLANEKGLSLIDQMPYEVDLSQYASGHGVSIKESGYFSQNEPIPDIGGNENLRQSIFSLQKDDVSELIEFDGKFYIIQVIEKSPSSLPELVEVYDKIKDDFSLYLAGLEAKSVAEKYLATLHEGKNWEGMAGESQITPETTDFFTRKDAISQIGFDPYLKEAAFSLGEDKRYPERVFENERGVFVIRWEEQKEIDKEKYEEEKAKYRYSLMLAKQQVIYKDWLESLKNKADIEIITPVSSE